MTNGIRPLAGVGLPALLGTLLLTAVPAGIGGSMAISATILALDGMEPGETLGDAVVTVVASGLFIGLFASVVILAALVIAGLPLAIAFARFNLAYPMRYLVSGAASVGLGAWLGSVMWQADAYGWLIGAAFALVSAWLWQAMLQRFDKSRHATGAAPASASLADA